MKLLALFLLSCSAAFAQIPFERILNADKEPGNWLTYSRDLQGHRFSPLSEINTENVSRLKVKWAFQFPDPGNEVSPVVIDGILYITGPNAAAALDGRSGHLSGSGGDLFRPTTIRSDSVGSIVAPPFWMTNFLSPLWTVISLPWT